VALDPASLQVLLARLAGVADEVGAVLRRAAHSPNIKERADCSAAVFTADGQLLAQAEHIPVHLGSMPASVRAAIDACGSDLRPGEQVIVNDPFAGGTHLNDVTLVAPVHRDDRLVGWVANRAHHADLGGMAPGSMPPAATEIHQEGLRIPPVRYGPEVEAIVVASSRTPAERRGDLAAQVGANRVGVARLAELAEEPFAEVLAHGERLMRGVLAALPDGRWAATDVLDSTGEGAGPATITATVTIAGDAVTVDLTGTDAQRPGSVNAVRAVTESAVGYAIRCVAGPSVPANAGSMRPVTVVAPAGTLVAATPPVAVGAGNVEVSQRVADVVLAALAQAVPGSLGAGDQGTMNNVLLGGNGWVYYETIGGGQGGRSGRPGMSGVHTGMTNTADTPIEALERALPVRVRAYRLRTGSGGAGRWAGGEGIVRELEVLEPVTLSLVTERRRSRPRGALGGEPGAPGENWLVPADGPPRPLPDKVTVALRPGDAVRLLTPGGGGYGNPV
jgi:N-methylhydantoinase B/oxoprolinase/acetone carboxylase alpha subunit